MRRRKNLQGCLNNKKIIGILCFDVRIFPLDSYFDIKSSQILDLLRKTYVNGGENMSIKSWWNRSQIKERSYKMRRYPNRIKTAFMIIAIGFAAMFVGMMAVDYYNITAVGLGIVIIGFALLVCFGTEEITETISFSDDETESQLS